MRDRQHGPDAGGPRSAIDEALLGGHGSLPLPPVPYRVDAFVDYRRRPQPGSDASPRR